MKLTIRNGRSLASGARVLGRGVAFVALAALLFASTAHGTSIIVAPGQKAPRFWGTSLGGKRLVVEWNEHRVTLVNFWATFCKPCRDEIPLFLELRESRGQDAFGVYGVLMEPYTEDVQKYMDDLGIDYPNLEVDEKTVGVWGGIGVVPTSYLVKQDGTVARRYVGSTPAQRRGLVADIEALLDGRPLGPMPEPGE